MIELLATLWLAQASPDKSYPPSHLSTWYKSLKQPGSQISCCDVSDCKPVEARTQGDHWQALIGERWVDVPPEKVLQAKENPTGSAVACWYQGTADYVAFYCFVVPSMI